MAVTINGTTGIVTPDLGVDGTTLVVDAANDRVGIGQSSPTKKLEVGGGAVSFSPDVAGKHTHEFTTNAANDARYFLRSDTIFFGPLSEPRKNFSYFFDLIICKLYIFYLKIFFKS